VPNAALRFKPEKSGKNGSISNAPPVLGNASASFGGRGSGEKKPKLYVLKPDGSLMSIRATVGITDGSWTEVSGEGLQENMAVVTGVLDAGNKDAVVNPFMPTPPSSQQRPPRM
jgi:hypothetical protein